MSNIVKIKLLLDLNIPGSKYIPLTYDRLYLSKEDKEQLEEIAPSELPFFSYHVQYATDQLQKLSYGERVQTFFNEQLFRERILRFRNTIEKDPDKQHKNAKVNLLLMVEVLFPIQYPVRDNIHVSFDEYIAKRATPIHTTHSILPDFILRLFRHNQEHSSMLQLHDGVYTVTGVTIVNDIIHSKSYRENIEKLSQFVMWRKNKVEDLEELFKKQQMNVVALFPETLKIIQNKETKETLDAELTELAKPYARYSIGGTNPLTLKSPLQKIHDELNSSSPNTTVIQDQLFEIYTLNSKRNSQRAILPNKLDTREFRYLLDENVKNKVGRIVIDDYFTSPKRIYDVLFGSKSKTEEDKISELIKTQLNKYPEWKYLFTLVQTMIPPKQFVTNRKLQALVTSFIQGTTDKNSIDLLKFATLVHHFMTSPKADTIAPQIKELFELGILVSNSSENKEKDKKEFTFQMEENNVVEVTLITDLVKGVLTEATLKDIRCIYKNAMLVEKYKELRYPNKSVVNIYRPPLLNVEGMKKEMKEMKKAQSKQNTKSLSKTRSNRRRIVGGFNPYSVRPDSPRPKKRGTKKRTTHSVFTPTNP